MALEPPSRKRAPLQWEEDRAPAALTYKALLAQLLQVFINFMIPVSQRKETEEQSLGILSKAPQIVSEQSDSRSQYYHSEDEIIISQRQMKFKFFIHMNIRKFSTLLLEWFKNAS